MKSLNKFCQELGISQTAVCNWVWRYPEVQKYVEVERRGLRYFYKVKDEKGLKAFLKKKGYPIPAEAARDV
jgi:DNA-binding transcriptional regulator PaaX